MRTAKIGGHDVVLYDSIDTLPILRFHAFNKMLLIDAGIGTDLADFDSHIERVTRFIAAKEYDNAVKELANMRQNVYMIQQGVAPKHLAFAALVKSIDGDACDDISSDGLAKTLARLNDATRQEIATEVTAAKKKIEEEVRLYFPRLADDTEVKEYHDVLRRRTLLQIDVILNGETDEKLREIDELTTRLVTSDKPKTFTGKDSAEIRHDKSFEDMCIVIAKELNIDAKKMTVLEYYNAFEFVREMKRQTSTKK